MERATTTTLPTVVIDGYALGDGSLARGIGTYLTHLLRGLAADPTLTPVVATQRTDVIPPGVRSHVIKRRGGWRFGPREHELLFPRELRRIGGDLLHSPAQHPPRKTPMPWIQTLLDLTPLVIDHPSTAGAKRRWTRLGPRLREAAAVITISEATARAGEELLGLDRNKLHVIYLGVDAQFSPGPAEVAEPPYLLTVGAWGPHKGHAKAFEVIGALADAGLPHRLVVAGPQDAWMTAQLEAARQASPHPDRIEIAGFVEDLPALYRGATAVLVTSESEGFCLPAVEGMACGTPVIAFANTALPEVLGDGGVLVPDGDVAAMLTEVRRLVDEPAFTQELRERAVARAAAFDWAGTVAAHLDIYHAVLNR